MAIAPGCAPRADRRRRGGGQSIATRLQARYRRRRKGHRLADKVRTIYDLAALAGVSPATVSRALAGKNLVNAETAARIRQLAQDHDFRPSALARNLRTRRRGAIGVVVPLGHDRGQHLSDPFFMTLIGALADELTERDLDLVLTRVIPSRPDWLTRMIDADRVDGLLIIGQSDQVEALDRTAADYLPMVVWGGLVPGQVHCSVGTDNFLGGKLAAQHLVDRGCRRIAFLGNTMAVEPSQRRDGARAVVDETPGATLIETQTHFASDVGGADIAQFLDESGAVPDGIFAASDLIASTAIQVLASRGLSVPGDVRIVGYDDLYLARTVAPPLTTVRQDIHGGARHMVASLFRRIEGERTGSIVLPPELIVRASS